MAENVLINKSFMVDGVEISILYDGIEYEVTGIYNGHIHFVNVFKELPKMYDTLWGLNLNEKLNDSIYCWYVDKEVF